MSKLLSEVLELRGVEAEKTDRLISSEKVEGTAV